jgi:hypothetical protein
VLTPPGARDPSPELCWSFCWSFDAVLISQRSLRIEIGVPRCGFYPDSQPLRQPTQPRPLPPQKNANMGQFEPLQNDLILRTARGKLLPHRTSLQARTSYN